jgi:hypothetical protein
MGASGGRAGDASCGGAGGVAGESAGRCRPAPTEALPYAIGSSRKIGICRSVLVW